MFSLGKGKRDNGRAVYTVCIVTASAGTSGMGMIYGNTGPYSSLRVLGPQKTLADTDVFFIAFTGH